MMAVGVGVQQRESMSQDERSYYNQSWRQDPKYFRPSLSQGYSQPQLSYGNGQYRVLDQRRDLGQGYAGDPTPLHVSFSQASLPPLVQSSSYEWRFPEHHRQEQQVERLTNGLPQILHKQGRWSCRQDDPNVNRLVYGYGEKGFVAPRPILHHSSPNLSLKSGGAGGGGGSIVSSPRSSEGVGEISSKAVDNQDDHYHHLQQQHHHQPKPEQDLSLRSINSSNPSAHNSPPAPRRRTPIQRSPRREEVREENNDEEQERQDETAEHEEQVTVEEPIEVTSPQSDAGSESSRDTLVSEPSLPVTTSLQRPRPVKSEINPRKKRTGFGRGDTKQDGKLALENLPPFTHPKEALSKTLAQLENPEWEVIMNGLKGLVRLAKHHSKVLGPSTHQAVIHVTRHVKNLRSQVARMACNAAQQLFISLGRSLDPEIDDLTGALLSRMADTNKFLRADSSVALDTLVDHISAMKCISALVHRGAKHQNALVRGATCRLLLRICQRLGPEKTMSLPKDTRDAVLITGANCLTEGSLDTRNYAKAMFTFLSADPKLKSVMTDVVPPNVMRVISKTLTRISVV